MTISVQDNTLDRTRCFSITLSSADLEIASRRETPVDFNPQAQMPSEVLRNLMLVAQAVEAAVKAAEMASNTQYLQGDQS